MAHDAVRLFDADEVSDGVVVPALDSAAKVHELDDAAQPVVLALELRSTGCGECMRSSSRTGWACRPSVCFFRRNHSVEELLN